MNTNEIGWIGRYGNKLLAMLKEHDPDRYCIRRTKLNSAAAQVEQRRR